MAAVTDSIDVVLNVFGMILLLVLGYYGFRLLSSLKSGVMERGWKYVAVGSIFLVIAQIGYIAAAFAPRFGFLNTVDIGIITDIVGFVFLIVGLRAHLLVWTPKELKERKHESEQLSAPSA